MSAENIPWLNKNVLVGFTEKRKSPGNPDGVAWHYDKRYQTDESNHYPGAIPVEDVRRRLFNFEPVLIRAEYQWDGAYREAPYIFAVNDQTGECKGVHGE